jgi:hypothetical protein
MMTDFTLFLLGAFGTWISFALLISVQSERWGRILFLVFCLSLITVGWTIRGLLS